MGEVSQFFLINVYLFIQVFLCVCLQSLQYGYNCYSKNLDDINHDPKTKILVLCNNSQKIDGFRHKRFTGLLELIQLYKQNPLEKF